MDTNNSIAIRAVLRHKEMHRCVIFELRDILQFLSSEVTRTRINTRLSHRE
jgi:hypothetical protein